MNIIISVIPHSQQRYETVGDWQFLDGNLEVTVSSMNNVFYEALVGIHEVIEALLCYKNGVSEKDVTKFDLKFERNRKEGNTDEPGDDPKAPYGPYHFFATSIERLLSQAFDLKWKKYEDAVNSL